MITGTTSTGFAFEVEEDIANDMELFEALYDIDNGDATAVVSVCRRILGDRKKALYDHLRGENGRVPVDAVIAAIGEIFEAVKGGKKS